MFFKGCNYVFNDLIRKYLLNYMNMISHNYKSMNSNFLLRY